MEKQLFRPCGTTGKNGNRTSGLPEDAELSPALLSFQFLPAGS